MVHLVGEEPSRVMDVSAPRSSRCAQAPVGEVDVDAEAGRVVLGARVVLEARGPERGVVGVRHIARARVDDGGQGLDRFIALPQRLRDVAGEDFLPVPAFDALGHVRVPEIGDAALAVGDDVVDRGMAL